MSENPRADASAKRALAVTIVVGAALGLLWGGLTYGLVDARAWNLCGLGVIFVVAGYAGVYALGRALGSPRRS